MDLGQLWANLIYLNSFLLRALIVFLFACAIFLGIWVTFKKLIIWTSNYWTRHFPEPAQQLNKYVETLFTIHIVEMAIFMVYISSKLSQPVIKPILNLTYTYSITTFVFPSVDTINLTPLSVNITDSIVTRSSIVSSENITAIIGIVSVLIIFLYFFSTFGKTKYFAEGSEIQKKYASIFFTPAYSVLWFGIIALAIDGALKNFENLGPELFLFCFGFVNLMLATPIPQILRGNFYNDGISRETTKLDRYIYNYAFIENFRQLPHTVYAEFISDSVLMFSIIVAIFALISNSNLLMLIFTEYCLLTIHFWASQLDHIPLRRVTIEFKDQNTSKTIENAFILEDSQEYYLIVQEDNSVKEIMKDTVSQIIYQID